MANDVTRCIGCCISAELLQWVDLDWGLTRMQEGSPRGPRARRARRGDRALPAALLRRLPSDRIGLGLDQEAHPDHHPAHRTGPAHHRPARPTRRTAASLPQLVYPYQLSTQVVFGVKPVRLGCPGPPAPARPSSRCIIGRRATGPACKALRLPRAAPRTYEFLLPDPVAP